MVYQMPQIILAYLVEDFSSLVSDRPDFMAENMLSFPIYIMCVCVYGGDKMQQKGQDYPRNNLLGIKTLDELRRRPVRKEDERGKIKKLSKKVVANSILINSHNIELQPGYDKAS